MGNFLVYILKSAACLAVFYLFYKLLMSRDTFHRFNRFALLGLLVLSSLLPLVEASVNSPAAVQETMLTLEQLLLLADIQPEGESMAAATPSDRYHILHRTQPLFTGQAGQTDPSGQTGSSGQLSP